MKASNANKVISVLLSVAMCPMMVPSAAFAAEDDAALDASSPSEQTQSADQAEGVDAGASLNDTIAPQSEATGEATDTPTGEAAAPAAAVAQVGETNYTKLEDAFAALSGSNRTLKLLDENAWDAATPVYYKAGEVSGYAAKLTDALTAAYQANAGDITMVCRPGSDLGTMTHGHVADNITIYGNGAYVSGGECDLEVDTFQYSRETGRQTNDAVTELAGETITINAYDVDNLGVWGQRNTNATVNVNLTNCDGKALGATNVQRVYVSGTSGMNNITLTDCDFITAATAVYSNADGTVAINNCSFTGSVVPVNFNHKATGAQTVTVANSSFKNCGTTGEWAAFAAPARFVNSGTGTLNATINGCSFADTVGLNGDILIGDGRTGQKSNEVTLTVTKTEANVQAQKPGYYGEGTTVANASLKGEVTTTAAEGLDGASIESIVTPAPAAVAEVNGKTYPSLQEAVDAARNATVKLLADTKENVTISTNNVTLDLNGHTLNGGTVEAKPALTVTARGVTVMDSSETQTGTIKREDTAENSGVSSHYVIDVQGSGWLTFESGNVTNGSGNAEGKGASLVRVGDDSVAKYPGLNIKGGNFTQNNFIVIKVDSGDLFLNGGTLNSTDSYAIENWHRATVKGGTVNGAVATWTYSGGHDSDLAISGGTINGDVKSVTYDGAEGKTAKVSITGGVVNGTLNTFDYSTGTTSNDPTKATIEVTSGTFSTNPSRYLVEGSTATPNGDGTFGVAKAYLAQVGETSYYTMDEAFKAQTTSGKAITLLRDYTTGSTFNSGSVARVVDLNGHTWTCTGTDANSAAFEINYSNASLTVKNGKIVSSQLIGLIPSASGGAITYNNSNLTFEGVEATTTATSGIETNGNNTNDTVVLKDSTLNVPNGFGIYFPSSGTLTIDNSTINAKTMGAQVCSGNLNVNSGSTITVSGDPVAKTEGDGAIQDGAAISIVNRPGYKGLGQIAITGGTFTAKDANAAIKAYTWDSSTKQESDFDNSAKTIAVSGGTFSSTVASDLCAEGCAPVANADGTYSVGVPVAQIGGNVFTSLQAAIDAAQAGDTVQLIADAVVDATVVVQDKGAITLDLNGKTISNTKEIWNEDINNWSLVSVRGNSDLTITGNGAIDALANDSYAIDLQDAASKCTIENGAFTGNISAVYVFDGSLTINGGTFDIKQLSGQGDHRFTINCYDSSYKNGTAQVSINGGTFNGFDPANNLAEGTGTAFTAPGYTSVANADGTYGVVAGVAQVAGKAFTSLQAAIDAAQNGETVTLLTDATEDATVAAGKNITLDLGGKTLTNTNTGKATLTIAKGATATVKNGNIVGGMSYYTIDNYGTTTLEDVTATAGNTDSSMIRNDGTLTIESGSYSGGLNVVKSEEDSTLIINGGKFELSHAVKYGYTAVILVYGNTTITDGEFVCSATTPNWAYPKVVMTGEVSGHPSFTKITGGSFVNKYSGGGIFHGYTPATSDNFEVSGGTFNKSITEGYCADGFIPTKNADGTYGVKEGHYVAQIGSKKYETLADAIRLAAKGKTITLLTDVEQNTQLTISKNITLDLNGKTIKNTQDIWGDNANAILSITNGAKVTITGNGTIDAKENDCYTINVVKGDLTIENGTFYGNVSVVQVQEGTLSVKGGTFDLHQKWEGSSKYLFNCIDDAYASGSANVAISGGTFVGFDPSASPEGKGTSYLAPGYAPTDNADGTYGVKLAEGAYLLQDYRSGDQASWTYPTQDGKAFAGWYKDAAFTAPCTANDVEGAAYAKFVNITDLLKYKGRSLRMDKGDPSETTYLRFGYTKAIPNGATYIENGWYYKRLSAPTGDDIRFAAYNNALNDDGTITSNLVFNNVKARLYTANFIEKAFVKYVTIDGTTVEAVEGAYHSSSVSEAADAIIAHPMASKAEKDYATSIKSAIQ